MIAYFQLVTKISGPEIEIVEAQQSVLKFISEREFHSHSLMHMSQRVPYQMMS
jgi:hypothetical protein